MSLYVMCGILPTAKYRTLNHILLVNCCKSVQLFASATMAKYWIEIKRQTRAILQETISKQLCRQFLKHINIYSWLGISDKWWWEFLECVCAIGHRAQNAFSSVESQPAIKSGEASRNSFIELLKPSAIGGDQCSHVSLYAIIKLFRFSRLTTAINWLLFLLTAALSLEICFIFFFISFLK